MKGGSVNPKKRRPRKEGVNKDAAAARLEDLRRQVKAEVGLSKARVNKRRRGKPRTSVAIDWKQLGLRAALVTAIIALPFLVYVRASVFFYNKLGGAPWVAVIGASLITLGLTAGYATWLARRVTKAARAHALARLVAIPMVAGYLMYSLLYLARVNAKTDDVQSYYLSLHPVLRVAVSTVTIIDPGAVITDMQRAPADYGRMGLKVNPRTRHYLQKDGWVHAVDIRTSGRWEIRNLLLQAYFWTMGFSTLRHVGTADHLHVQLR
jgi:hypothetical protein